MSATHTPDPSICRCSRGGTQHTRRRRTVEMRSVSSAMRGKSRAGVTAKEMTAVVSGMKRAIVVRDKTIMRMETVMRMGTIVGMTIVKMTVMMIENDE